MACTVSTGRSLPCKSAFGGIKTIYFADFGGLTGLTFTDGKVSAFTGSVSGWTKWDVKGNSNLETTVTSSRENGTTFYTQTLNATFTYLDAATQNELQVVAVGRPYVAVEDYYGNVFLCGFENGMDSSLFVMVIFGMALTSFIMALVAFSIYHINNEDMITAGNDVKWMLFGPTFTLLGILLNFLIGLFLAWKYSRKN